VSSTRTHWEQVWLDRDPATNSWYQDTPTRSLELVRLAGVGPDDPIVDIGGGCSALAITLSGLGYEDLTVLDIAQGALETLDRRLIFEFGAHAVRLLRTDVLSWRPDRPYRLWHDRALNHFFSDPVDRQRYVDLAAATITRGGHLVVAAFAPDGPDTCSGLTVHRRYPEGLAAEFAEAFDLVRITRELHETPWQATQSFQYVLLQRR